MTRRGNAVCIALVCLAAFCTAGLLWFYSIYAQQKQGQTMDYASTLFDTSYVHTIDIQMDDEDWAEFLDTATDEEYTACDVVVDGTSYPNVAIRAKGNNSLSGAASAGTGRYSFKIEFDHYESGQTCDGLDKLNLNNVIYDNTYMKDYLCYTLMAEMGVDSPLAAYINVTVNGERFGLYIAVEAVEESFATRTYGGTSGNLYKPDSMDLGGSQKDEDSASGDEPRLGMGDGTPPQDDGNGGQPPEKNTSSAPTDDNITQSSETADTRQNAPAQDDRRMQAGDEQNGGRSGASDVALQYTDDDPNSYSNIFDNAIFDITDTDQQRLIDSLKKLNTGEDLESVLNIDEVIRYFAVHNFVCSYDSYTGSLMHNYYLYEENGQLSVIAWDYNLAFGGFGGHGSTGSSDASDTETSVSTATQLVNDGIDTPCQDCEEADRPLLNAILSNEDYLDQYHVALDALVSNYFESGYVEQLIEKTRQLIAPYVQDDPTAYCTYEEFEEAVDTLKEFCSLRAESVRGQLAGEYPTTDDAQNYKADSYVDAGELDISAMGGNGGGGGNPSGGMRPGQQAETSATENTAPQGEDTAGASPDASGNAQTAFAGGEHPGGGQMPQNHRELNGGLPGDETEYTATLVLGGICLLALMLTLILVKLFKRRKW